ncbi:MULTISPECIES: hypothetical protein [Emticicia]|nr:MULTISPECIES: hypothetical protein [Emticicia]UTA68096.1 hypothetical protein MB380_21250 [Emticicia sp. 21SJ11W-3]
MKTEKTESAQDTFTLEEWTKPSVEILSIMEVTMGSSDAGEDYASEIS